VRGGCLDVTDCVSVCVCVSECLSSGFLAVQMHEIDLPAESQALLDAQLDLMLWLKSGGRGARS
jgi:hypothetical protein